MSTVANFDRLARAYRWLEALTLGPMLMRTRCALLSELRGCRNALVIGDGDGRFAARLLAANPDLIMDAVDASPAMLARLRYNAGKNAARVRAHTADARTWQPQRSDYDLIATHFFLDCLTNDELHALALGLRNACAPNALWVVSEFAVPRGVYGAVVARPLVALLYRVFGMLTGLAVRQLPDHHEALAGAGFEQVCRIPRLRGLLVSELWRAQSI